MYSNMVQQSVQGFKVIQLVGHNEILSSTDVRVGSIGQLKPELTTNITNVIMKSKNDFKA